MGFLTGKTALITGAGRAVLQDGSCGSIGYGIATAYAKEGANLVITGRNVKKLEEAPTLKISTNTPLAEKKGGWIDFNTGVIADGEKTIDEAAKDLLDLVIRVASGEQTKAEKHGFREISIFKDGVVL